VVLVAGLLGAGVLLIYLNAKLRPAERQSLSPPASNRPLAVPRAKGTTTA
jgi:hypothetical protein